MFLYKKQFFELKEADTIIRKNFYHNQYNSFQFISKYNMETNFKILCYYNEEMYPYYPPNFPKICQKTDLIFYVSFHAALVEFYRFQEVT